MRKEGIGCKRFELEMQEQSSRELTGSPKLEVGALFLVRVRVEFLSPLETAVNFSQASEVQLLVMNG